MCCAPGNASHLHDKFLWAGGVELQGHMKTFKIPARLDSIDLNVRVSSFSLTAWVRTSTQFVSGYIVRKRVASSGLGEKISCWGWWLR